jgi:DNA-directed RNA polymerase subunit RPC12/RpoP
MTKNEKILLNALRWLKDRHGVGDKGEDRINAALCSTGHTKHSMKFSDDHTKPLNRCEYCRAKIKPTKSDLAFAKRFS